MYVWASKLTKLETYQLLDPFLEGVSYEVGEGLLERPLRPNEVLVGLGKHAFEWAQQTGLVPKNRKLTSFIGVPLKWGNGWVVLNYSPGYLLISPESKSIYVWGLRMASRLELTGSSAPVVGQYRFVEDFTDVLAALQPGSAVSLDLETTSLDPFKSGSWIVSISLTYRAGYSDVVLFTGQQDQPSPLHREVLFEQIKHVCTNPDFKLRGANLKFDKLWMWVHWGIHCVNDTMDTALVGGLLDENRENSLENHTKWYIPELGGYDAEMNKQDKGKMAEISKAAPQMFLTYAGGDTDACFRVANKMRTELVADKQLANFYVKLLHPAQQVFTVLEKRGMLVDKDRYRELEALLRTEIKEAHERAWSLVSKRLWYKHSNDRSLTRAAVLKDILFSPLGFNLTPVKFTPKTGEPSMTADHFKQLNAPPQAQAFLDAYSEFTKAGKILSTYVVGFQAHIRDDGKFHPNYYMVSGLGQAPVTGRLSARDPAFQTIPKRGKWAKLLRSVFVPPPGHVILQPDYSQGELRITACVADEQVMLKAYREGIDLHALTAAGIMEMTLEEFHQLPPEDQENLRRQAKAINFGLIYGMMPPGFVEYARASYGVVLTVGEATSRRDIFFSTYPGLLPWHERTKRFAHVNQHVRSPLGRIRHLPMIRSKDREIASGAERQAINSPVQATLSDMMLLAMVELYRRYPDLWLFGMTHDSQSMYVPEDEWEAWAARVKDVMENLPLDRFGWNPPVAFPVDMEMGVTSLADLKKVKVG